MDAMHLDADSCHTHEYFQHLEMKTEMWVKNFNHTSSRVGFLKQDSMKKRLSKESNNKKKKKGRGFSTTRMFRLENNKGIAWREKNADTGKKGI